jgi:hypothetical protein
MARGELAHPVQRRGCADCQRLGGEETAHVVGEMAGRRIPQRGIARERGAEDDREIGVQATSCRASGIVDDGSIRPRGVGAEPSSDQQFACEHTERVYVG